MSNKFIAVELFSGGGGLAVGLRNAKFSVAAAVELAPHAAATFAANHKGVRVFQQDVRTVGGKSLKKVAGGKIDLLAACPPCQGFSSLTSKYAREDERNDLVLEVGRLAAEMKPAAIMMENVPGLAHRGKKLLDQLVRKLKSIGYIVNWDVLQVADFGVPQLRRRFVLLAGLGFEIKLPKPTHARVPIGKLKPYRTVRDAIGHLDGAITFTEAKDRGGAARFNWHVVRTLSPENVIRLKLAKPGAQGQELPEHVRPSCHQNGYKGFSNVYGRLSWDQPSATITAGCTTLSKGRFGHPKEQRTISLREAALLQTFPANYKFDTEHMERACEIVGNALPCLFAEVIARQCRLAIAKQTKSAPRQKPRARVSRAKAGKALAERIGAAGRTSKTNRPAKKRAR
ncbi:DNA cytosine methyltransferase [Dongia sp.]|uniref:DNA cytosine methyltransferase n=1 Tax=Dongia sp. TaxID=1977262 RepID=UPI0035B2CF7F